ncbi:MAG: TatD family hydrolase [Candidatus Gottesmanbacteria bacterium]|nr:TatD family hydrolase [Candidatus Gottesmanbacteria bacterium]
MFIDTHCHLTFSEYDPDRAMVIGNAKKAGVKQFISPSVDPFSSRQSVILAEKNPRTVFAGIGYHPYEAQHTPQVTDLEQLIQMHKDSIVAIGEIGLDYHQYKGEEAAGKKQNQKILFEEQLQLALKHNLPVIMHCRDAFEDFFAVLDILPTQPGGVIHCFSGGLQEIRLAKERKLLIGLDGNITYSKQLQAIIPDIPLSVILLETDAPYLTPVPHRGTRNEPKYIPLIAAEIARLLNINIHQVENQTTVNAKTLFRI